MGLLLTLSVFARRFPASWRGGRHGPRTRSAHPETARARRRTAARVPAPIEPQPPPVLQESHLVRGAPGSALAEIADTRASTLLRERHDGQVRHALRGARR